MQTVPTTDFLILLSFRVEIRPSLAISNGQQDIPTGGLRRRKQLLPLSSHEPAPALGKLQGLGWGGLRKGRLALTNRDDPRYWEFD